MQSENSTFLNNDLNRTKQQLQKVNEKIVSLCTTCKNNHKTDLSAAIVKNQVQITHLKDTVNRICDNLSVFNDGQTSINNQLTLVKKNLETIWQNLDALQNKVDEHISNCTKEIWTDINQLKATVNQLVLKIEQIKNVKDKQQTNKNTIITAVIASIIIGILGWLGSAAMNNIFKDSGRHINIENTQQK